MEKISIFIIFYTLLFCSYALGYDCNFDYYYKPGQGCVPCPPCDPGKEITDHCGHDRDGNTTGARCRDCVAGWTYSDKKTRESCKNCQQCGKENKIELKACTLKSNTVCGCPKGSYEGDDGDCVKCSYCCGENWEQNKNIVPECKAQGLGRCVCSPSWKCLGKQCSAPTSAPTTTPTISTQEPKQNATSAQTTTTKVSTTTSPRREEPKQKTAQVPSATVIFKSPGSIKHEDDPKAQQKDNPVVPFFGKPGWIVLFCLLAVVCLAVIAWCHKRTRKQITGRCCGRYGVLSPEGEATSVLVEGHYVEQAEGELTNNATPIPPWEEPVPPILQYSSTAEELRCSCKPKRTENEQMQCTCTVDTSETSIEKLVQSSSSEELQLYCSDRKQERQNSASPFSSSRGSSPRSDHYCIASPSTSSCLTPTPPRGRSPDHYYRATPSSCSTCVTPSLPRKWSPDRFYATSSSNSPCVTPPLPRGRSPEHRCATTSSYSTCVTETPPRGRSPDPSSLPSFQSHSSFSDEQEMSNQSSENTQSSELLTIPISVEAYDKEHDRDVSSKVARKDTPPAQVKRNEGRAVGEKESPSPKRTCPHNCELRLKERWPPNDTADTVVDITPIPTSDRGAGCVTMATSGNDSKREENECLKNQANIADEFYPKPPERRVNPLGDCRYRRIKRTELTEHRCSECCPQPDDSFFQLINRERLCLKEEICKELSRSYKDLAILGRVDSDLSQYKNSSNPAERVLDRIKALEPGLKLNEFEEMLRKIKRLDIVQLIQNHHLSCTFCQRNRFDSKS